MTVELRRENDESPSKNIFLGLGLLPILLLGLMGAIYAAIQTGLVIPFLAGFAASTVFMGGLFVAFAVLSSIVFLALLIQWWRKENKDKFVLGLLLTSTVVFGVLASLFFAGVSLPLSLLAGSLIAFTALVGIVRAFYIRKNIKYGLFVASGVLLLVSAGLVFASYVFPQMLIFATAVFVAACFLTFISFLVHAKRNELKDQSKPFKAFVVIGTVFFVLSPALFLFSTFGLVAEIALIAFGGITLVALAGIYIASKVIEKKSFQPADGMIVVSVAVFGISVGLFFGSVVIGPAMIATMGTTFVTACFSFWIARIMNSAPNENMRAANGWRFMSGLLLFVPPLLFVGALLAGWPLGLVAISAICYPLSVVAAWGSFKVAQRGAEGSRGASKDQKKLLNKGNKNSARGRTDQMGASHSVTVTPGVVRYPDNRSSTSEADYSSENNVRRSRASTGSDSDDPYVVSPSRNGGSFAEVTQQITTPRNFSTLSAQPSGQIPVATTSLVAGNFVMSPSPSAQSASAASCLGEGKNFHERLINANLAELAQELWPIFSDQKEMDKVQEAPADFCAIVSAAAQHKNSITPDKFAEAIVKGMNYTPEDVKTLVIQVVSDQLVDNLNQHLEWKDENLSILKQCIAKTISAVIEKHPKVVAQNKGNRKLDPVVLAKYTMRDLFLQKDYLVLFVKKLESEFKKITAANGNKMKLSGKLLNTLQEIYVFPEQDRQHFAAVNEGITHTFKFTVPLLRGLINICFPCEQLVNVSNNVSNLDNIIKTTHQPSAKCIVQTRLEAKKVTVDALKREVTAKLAGFDAVATMTVSSGGGSLLDLGEDTPGIKFGAT